MPNQPKKPDRQQPTANSQRSNRAFAAGLQATYYNARVPEFALVHPLIDALPPISMTKTRSPRRNSHANNHGVAYESLPPALRRKVSPCFLSQCYSRLSVQSLGSSTQFLSIARAIIMVSMTQPKNNCMTIPPYQQESNPSAVSAHVISTTEWNAMHQRIWGHQALDARGLGVLLTA